jgi:FixJ family two-component response regulator
LSTGIIHIVDDDAAVRDSTRMLLEAYGYDVRMFASTAEFMTAFDPAVSDVLLLDQNMPVETGLQFLVRFRAAGHVLPVVLASGRINADLKARALAAGAQAVLRKPVEAEELLALIGKLSGKRAP